MRWPIIPNTLKFCLAAVGYHVTYTVLHNCYHRTCSPTIYNSLFGTTSIECSIATEALRVFEKLPLLGFVFLQNGNLRRQILHQEQQP
jgi:hypothetical protein